MLIERVTETGTLSLQRVPLTAYPSVIFREANDVPKNVSSFFMTKLNT